MIEKETVNQSIDALAGSLKSRVSLTVNIIRLTLAESKLAFKSLVLTIVLAFLVLVLLVCAWLVLQTLLFAILKEHLALSSVQSLSIILIFHITLIVLLCLLVQRLCKNLTFRHLRAAMAPITLHTDAEHSEAMTGTSINNAEFENRTPLDTGSRK